MKKIVVLLVLMFALFTGCAYHSFIENGYDTIATANSTVDGLMTYLGEQHCAGAITDIQKADIVAAYEKYRLASNFADEALAVYALTKTKESQEAYTLALVAMMENKQTILSLANIILYGGGK